MSDTIKFVPCNYFGKKSDEIVGITKWDFEQSKIVSMTPSETERICKLLNNMDNKTEQLSKDQMICDILFNLAQQHFKPTLTDWDNMIIDKIKKLQDTIDEV